MNMMIMIKRKEILKITNKTIGKIGLQEEASQTDVKISEILLMMNTKESQEVE
jgi:DNA replication protein DnaD